MIGKPDTDAHYVFVTKKSTVEVSIHFNNNCPAITKHGCFIRSGSGTCHLVLSKEMCEDSFWDRIHPEAACKHLEKLFNEAYDRQMKSSDNMLFSKEYDADYLLL